MTSPIRQRLAVVTCVAAIAGSACGGTTPPTAGGGASTPLGTATGTPVVTPPDAGATPTAVPIATFATTWERALEAPTGAVAIDMTFVTDKPRFQPNAVTATAGTLTFFLRNVRYLTAVHDFRLGPELLQAQAASPKLQASQSIAFTVGDVPPGTYTFWCDITLGGVSHYQEGMVGTLTVTP